MNFTVKAASKKKDVPDGKYGPMVVYALTLQNGDGAVNAEWFTKASTPLPAIGSQLEGELEDGKYGKNFKRARQNGAGGFSRSPEEKARIERQHSQEMAVRVVALNVDIPEGISYDDLRGLIKDWTDWFVADLDNAGAGIGGGVASSDARGTGHDSLPPAADASVGLTDNQRDKFVRPVLERIGADAALLIPYLDSLTREDLRPRLDALGNKELDTQAVAQKLQTEAEEWQTEQPSDVPKDETDLHSSIPIGAADDDIPF